MHVRVGEVRRHVMPQRARRLRRLGVLDADGGAVAALLRGRQRGGDIAFDDGEVGAVGTDFLRR